MVFRSQFQSGFWVRLPVICLVCPQHADFINSLSTLFSLTLFIVSHTIHFIVEYLFLLSETEFCDCRKLDVWFPTLPSPLILTFLEHSPYFMTIGCLNSSIFESCVCKCICVQRPEVNLRCHPPWLLEMSLHWMTDKLIDSASLATQLGLGIYLPVSTSLVLGLQRIRLHTTTLGLLCGFWETKHRSLCLHREHFTNQPP